MNITERIKKVISVDKQYNFDNLKELIRSDEFFLLKNYFDVEFDKIDIDITKDDFGAFYIQISTKANRVKMPKTLI